MAMWKACGELADDTSKLKGRPCFAGLDLGATKDMIVGTDCGLQNCIRYKLSNFIAFSPAAHGLGPVYGG